ncbi:zinc finger protein 287-like [Bactrocera tryoni]|uniref:zinc finger protein 287-like n=1 Tax=Bactrocera tryoni TaxID=59916 RepID=UPI001A9874FC|nr:zinc finger protein 287-like [Bactrocera tryoni]
MSALSIENVKEYCRTCLKKLKRKNINCSINLEEEEELSDCRDFCISIVGIEFIQQFITSCMEEQWTNEEARTMSQEYPQYMCIYCYKKLQGVVSFKKQVRNSTQRLKELLCLGAPKAEIVEDGEHQEIDKNSGVEQSTTDIFNLLLKDTLMETESVLINAVSDVAIISKELSDPDPFDNGPPVDISKKENVSDDNCESYNEECYDFKGEDSNEGIYERIIEHDKVNLQNNVKSSTAVEAKAQQNQRRDSSLEIKKYPTRSRRKRSLPIENTNTENTTDKKTKSRKVGKVGGRIQLGLGTDHLDITTKRRNKGTKNNFKCMQCSHSFAHKITLDAHIRKVHEGSKRPFQCDRCEKSYTFIGGLYTHIKEIHDAEVRSYACDISGCERIYTSFIAMQKHKRLKHSDTSCLTKYVCEQCGATFNQSGNLKYHRRAKHPTEAEQAEKEQMKERFECDICKKLFYSRYTLKYHTLQLHTNETKYECNICGRRMAKKFMLVQHMLVHSNDKMPCEHCGKQFIRKFELEAHVKAVHMKLKPFECQYCSECFASRKTLRHHEYIHTGEKPYVCDVCGQAYRQQTSLKSHRKSHEKFDAESKTMNVNQELINSFLIPQPHTTPHCS